MPPPLGGAGGTVEPGSLLTEINRLLKDLADLKPGSLLHTIKTKDLAKARAALKALTGSQRGIGTNALAFSPTSAISPELKKEIFGSSDFEFGLLPMLLNAISGINGEQSIPAGDEPPATPPGTFTPALAALAAEAGLGQAGFGIPASTEPPSPPAGLSQQFTPTFRPPRRERAARIRGGGARGTRRTVARSPRPSPAPRRSSRPRAI